MLLMFKNNIYLPPMAKELCVNGQPNLAMLDYYTKQAQQGFGLIILEHAYVSENGKASPGQLSIAADYDATILRKIAEVIHKYRAKAVMQINHCGAKSRVVLERKLAPSIIENDDVQALTKTEIQGVVLDFIQSALRVKQLGFDGVEVHSAHGYLLNQFYSPLTNKRQDEYGGCLENRLRLHVEILQGIKKELGDFPLFLRLGACDYMEGGNDLATAVKAAKFLAPHLDYLDISGGISGYQTHIKGALCYFAEVAQAIKQEINLPILTAGGIKTFSEAQRVITNGVCDLAGIGRTALAPNFRLFCRVTEK